MRTGAGAVGGTGAEASAEASAEADVCAEVSHARAPRGTARPRAMVLDEVWRELDGVGPLSGPQGGPLSRTVKLLLDPLVIRPVLHPQCAGPLVTAEGVALLAALIHASADALRATAAWFTLLKQVRRGLRITEGNPQDLYFQLCFELAATQGPPAPATGGRIAEETLREAHGSAQGRTTWALREYLTDPAHTGALTSALHAAWAARTVEPAPGVRPDEGRDGGVPAVVRTVLDACPVGRQSSTRDFGTRDFGTRAPGGRRSGAGSTNGGAALARLITDHAGTAAGRALWGARPEAAPRAGELGLTRHPVPVRPGLGDGSASTSALGLPFDRTVHERVFTVLQTSHDRAALAPVPELVRREIGRSCAPWALTDESLRVAATVGVQLALGLRPLGEGPGAVGETGAHRAINSRWRREAYVLQARRLAVSLDTDSDPADPANASDASDASDVDAAATVAEPLARIARELRAPWRAYLRRLWVRLHGRDVRDAPMTGVEELWNVLDGVARSVMLDHRDRVRHALSARPAAPEGRS
ncbi:hypothetical protein ABTZ59_32045 [Streptomyces sp. NPDC094034]|uniref:hypothetical protein n=1 Tax=Streptomyces sp. NPDC094034 TaxID=3155309 RepID=UPI00331E26EA